MSDVSLRIKVEAGKDFFHFYDKTGLYDPTKNPNGWKNADLALVISSVVNIYIPKSSGFIQVDLYPNVPNNKGIGMEIIPADLGLGSFDPGVYKYDYIVTLSDDRILTQSCYIFFYEPLECCIEKKKGQVDLMNPSSENAKKLIELTTLFKNAQYAACRGNYTAAQDISDIIWMKCDCCC